MRNMKRAFAIAVAAGCTAAALATIALAAYFAKGVFKDVFVNRKDYFSADVLYSIGSIDAENIEAKIPEVGSSGMSKIIHIYNHDVASGDFNGFPITFDVYAWLSGDLPEEKSYTLKCGEEVISVNTTEHAQPVLTNLLLEGGACSTVTLTAEFGYSEGDDLTRVPGLYVVAVPTDPERMTKSCIGALIRPTWSDAFAFTCGFDENGEVKDNAAFIYRVTTVGNAADGDKIVVKWKSHALILIKMNGKEPADGQVQEGDFGNGFDRKIVLDAQANHSDRFTFFRNTEDTTWENQTWADLTALVSTEYVENNTQE